MLIGVIVLNLAIALYGFYLTWQMWNLRRSFSQAADTLNLAEQNTHNVLNGAPEGIGRTGGSIRQFHQNYRALEPRLQQAQKALAVIGMGRSLMFNMRFSQRLRKSATKRMNR
ncbi:hypothetical protein [Leptolyngbya sp. NIES-2104]|uniref:hypothetical protein n=1 Tax=Leptolyngbya sp. NIES-2104 TaxID=1552121 RepID=UPI0006EC9065|nr:hypothetical protein [Leptolyngbya sp. NIES-2104]GAP96971.1 hypothetical protein NIES2104_35180 [Leptolyngbya sp. NIES-2104]